MKVVRFTRNVVPYNGGELAGFDDERADELIADGSAVEVNDPSAVDQVTPAPTVIEEIDMTPRRKGRK